MFIRFYGTDHLPFRSFRFTNLEFKDYSVKIIDLNGVAHQVQNFEFSYFVVINR